MDRTIELFDKSKFSATKHYLSRQSSQLAVHFHQWWRWQDLHATLINIYNSGGDHLLLLLKCTTTASLCSLLLSGLHKCSANIDEYQWVPFFSAQRNSVTCLCSMCTSMSCQMAFCQTAPLLPSVTQQENVMEHWWEGPASTDIPPTSISDTVSQHNKVGGITFGAAF